MTRTSRSEINMFLAAENLPALPSEVTSLDVSSIEIWEFKQDPESVDAMAQQLESGGSLSPICVSDGPEENDRKYRIMDGHHRLLAHAEAGRKTILGYVVSSASRDAIMEQFDLDDVAISALIS